MKWWLIVLSWMMVSPVQAQTSSDIGEVDALLKQESIFPTLSDRLDFVSQAFIGRPYLQNGPLGEGEIGKYDQDPLYRTDGFDCTTFVETTLALARSFHLDDFLDQLNHIRYQDGIVDFTLRNHFVEIDWNPNNEKAGFLKDVTVELTSPSERGEAIQTVSKRKWYEGMDEKQVQLLNPTSETVAERLKELRAEGARFDDVVSHLPYVKSTSISDALIRLNSPAVLNIVRTLNGTTLVTHQVLLVVDHGSLRVRQASSKSGVMKVTDQSLAEFAKAQAESPSTRGINVQKILDR